MQTVNALGLPFKLDQLTEGRGNCFPIAILQQLKRPEIFSQLNSSTKMMLKARSPVKLLRLNVKRLITISKCEHRYVERMMKYYNETEGMVTGMSWDEYWKDMNKDMTWVDSWFIRATAWYLNLDLWIVDCASRDDHPFIRISGNLEDEDVPCTGPIMTIGAKSNCHYQSLLPIETFHLSSRQLPESLENGSGSMFNQTNSKYMNIDSTIPRQKVPETQAGPSSMPNYVKENPPEIRQGFAEDNKDVKERGKASPSCHPASPEHKKVHQEEKDPFIYEAYGELLIFKRMSDNYTMKCPKCQVETKHIVQHIMKNATCQNFFDAEKFKKQFTLYKASKVLLDQRLRQQTENRKQQIRQN